MVTLTGKESLYVIGASPEGELAPIVEQITTGDIANVSPTVHLLRQTSTDYQVTLTDARGEAVIQVDATGGARTVTYPVSLTTGFKVFVVKVDTTANPVIISANGTTPLDAIVTPKSLASVGSRFVWSDGVNLYSSGIG